MAAPSSGIMPSSTETPHFRLPPEWRLTRLVGLYSSAPQCGKTTVAAMLSDRGHVVVPFASTLKQMLVPMLMTLGYEPQRAWDMVLRDKEFKVPELGVTVRHMLQTLGTEYGRQCVHPRLWLICWEKQAMRYHRVVADDVRFANEAALIRHLGGEMWLVRRPGMVHSTDHASEGELDGFDFDQIIENDGTLDELRSKVFAALDD